ncbi:glycosyltransferase 87 family protein [Actinosynnema sp. NPDC020468]|uniref:glycosyltransferase 87 family protein n=1 Tax=Actinosynnema sp. NPDC020468 TaxID=3154488 RepID=UPI0033D42344
MGARVGGMAFTAWPVALIAVFGVVASVLDLPIGIDSGVYRSGALAVLHGEPLYGVLTATPSWSPRLPFTYPPIAAGFFLPLAAVPAQAAWAVLAAASVVAVRVVVKATWSASAVPFLAVSTLEPVWRTIGFGQVNLVLMAAVVLDVLVSRGSRYGGVAIGVAAAIKLTPLVFVLHLLITGRRRDAGRALATFVGLQALGLVLLPADSLRYWGSALLEGNHAIGNGWLTNQSVFGAVQRLSAGADRAPVLSAVLALCCLVVGAVAARLAHRRGADLAALLITAFTGLLVSPISWSHHWVWVVPLAGLLVRARHRVAAVALWVVFAGWVATVPLDAASSGSAVLDNGYVLAAGLGGAIAALGYGRARTRSGGPHPLPDRS